MAVKQGLTVTTDFKNVTAREIDFVTRFADNWQALRDILGIMNPIQKTAGTTLKSYKAKAKNGLEDSVAEGETIKATEFEIEQVGYEDITVEKYKKSVSVEDVAKYGATIAVEKTDDAFLVELQNKVMNGFYTFLKGGQLIGTQTTWQKALAIAKGAVLNKFASMNKTVTDVVGFVNIMDVYKYLGEKDITIQSLFGIQYVKDFLGYSTLFLLPDTILASGKVIAVPTENIDLYYINPSDSDFAKLGLEYTTDGETNLIGFHVEGDYSTATGDSYALMGMKLWAEYIDGIAVVTVGSEDSAPAVPETSSVG